ncbi:MAG: DUF1801 domain-containing protein [Candidatus Kariarchaeaceae archaeon]|jgi:hypothetical protein
MQSKAETVEEYLGELSVDRREILSKVREVVLDNLPDGYEEVMQYGMISYVIPLEVFPKTYNKQPLSYLSLASQKNHIALYMNNIYADKKLKEWFVKEYKASGKKLDMGKSCVRFKKLENLPLDVIAKTVTQTSTDEFITLYKHAKKTSDK